MEIINKSLIVQQRLDNIGWVRSATVAVDSSKNWTSLGKNISKIFFNLQISAQYQNEKWKKM